MAALNFPNSPTVNDEVELGGKTYKWDGVKWLMIKVITPTPPTAQALAPTITEVSTALETINFTITNNDTETAVIIYETNDTLPDENSIELAGGATSGTLTITGLTVSPAILYASANVVGKVKSNITEKSFTFTVLVFTAATGGTTEEYNLDGKRYRSHTFTSSGNFVVTTVGDTDGNRNRVDYLIVAGGGGAGGGDASGFGGGGGGGGYKIASTTVSQTTFGVTVGLGGATAPDSNGSNGQDSTVFSNTANGGGGGGRGTGAATINAHNNGVAGGSGGGAGGFGSVARAGGAGIAGQGFKGGDKPSGGWSGPGGGGGATAAGQNGEQRPGTSPEGKGGDGGAGIGNTYLNATTQFYCGGGGSTPFGLGGIGGGGSGALYTTPLTPTTPGVANTGGGGGGGGYNNVIPSDTQPQPGGSGIVIIRYEVAPSV
jgi:hypothetical protein